jgi:hypothetical protein
MSVYRTLGVLLGAVLPLGLVPPAPAAPEKQDPAANAALKYWQAFGALPRRDKDQENLLQEWNTAPLGDAGRKLVDAGRDSLVYLHRGAKLRDCEWGLDFEDGPRLLAQHLDRGHTVARLACLRARYEFEAGDRRAAVEDVLATLVLARHLSSDGLMISILWQLAIVRPALDLLAAHLTEMDAPLLERLAARLDALPRGGSLAEAFRKEKEIGLGWFATRLREIPEEGAWQDQVVRFCTRFSDHAEKDVRAILKAAGNPAPARMARRVEELGAYYDELAKLVALPTDRFEAGFTALNDKTKAADPLAELFIPMKGLGGLRKRDAEMRARMALLRAAVAVAQGGPEKRKAFRDPFGDGPFDYRALQGGFELKSKLLIQGRPITLTAGRPKKP